MDLPSSVVLPHFLGLISYRLLTKQFKKNYKYVINLGQVPLIYSLSCQEYFIIRFFYRAITQKIRYAYRKIMKSKQNDNREIEPQSVIKPRHNCQPWLKLPSHFLHSCLSAMINWSLSQKIYFPSIQWLLLNFFVQKVFETNLNFRYQRVQTQKN